MDRLEFSPNEYGLFIIFYRDEEPKNGKLISWKSIIKMMGDYIYD